MKNFCVAGSTPRVHCHCVVNLTTRLEICSTVNANLQDFFFQLLFQNIIKEKNQKHRIKLCRNNIIKTYIINVFQIITLLFMY